MASFGDVIDRLFREITSTFSIDDEDKLLELIREIMLDLPVVIPKSEVENISISGKRSSVVSTTSKNGKQQFPCMGITNQGKKCSKKTDVEGGYCAQHLAKFGGSSTLSKPVITPKKTASSSVQPFAKPTAKKTTKENVEAEHDQGEAENTESITKATNTFQKRPISASIVKLNINNPNKQVEKCIDDIFFHFKTEGGKSVVSEIKYKGTSSFVKTINSDALAIIRVNNWNLASDVSIEDEEEQPEDDLEIL